MSKILVKKALHKKSGHEWYMTIKLWENVSQPFLLWISFMHWNHGGDCIFVSFDSIKNWVKQKSV